MHDRAHHIMEKNPSMPKSEAFAIATQQSHATGHTPEGYGTAKGKAKAKRKYDHPSQYEETADPGSKSKSSSMNLAVLMGFSDELQKISAVLVRRPTRTPLDQPTPLADPTTIQSLPATAAGNYLMETVR